MAGERTVYPIVFISIILSLIISGCMGTPPPSTPTDTVTSTPAVPAVIPVSVGLELKADGFTAPLGLISSGDGTGRLFVVDQIGVIKILMPNGTVLDKPFLDIRNKIVSLNGTSDDRGLLGLAFHPKYKDSGRFFVYYSGPLRSGAPQNFDHTNYVSEFKVSANDTNMADPDSEQIVLIDDHPGLAHNAGQISFGPDGFLYIPIGDGGNAGDVGIGHAPEGNGQNLSTVMGKILRIDIDRGNPYGIPSGNPFASGKIGLPEIFAYGFRNPYRISFDAGGSRSLFAGDAGQNLWEEVDLVTKDGNYGWNIKEGTHCYNTSNADVSPPSCPSTGRRGEPLIDPVIEFANARQSGGLSVVVIGGFVYRGSALSQLNGNYIFGGLSRRGDQPDGSMFMATPPSHGGKMWPMQELRINTNASGRIGAYVRSFGQDDNNELYVLTSQMPGTTGNTGKVFKIVP